MAWRISLMLAILAFPSLSFAAQTGFPSQSLWLSDTKPSIGEKVRIYTVLYNGTDIDTSGTLTFFVNGKSQETKSVTIKSSESTVLSSLWTATEGDYSFSATFGASGMDAQTSATVSITVDAPPSQLQQTVTQAKDIGTQVASTSLPIVSSIANTVFQATESFRNAGIDYLEKAAAPDSGESQRNPSVLGVSAQSVKPVEGFEANGASAATAGGTLSKITSVAAAAALYTFKSLWLFYPLLVILLLMIFRWLYKWVTRPRF